MADFSSRLKELRKERKITQQDLARGSFTVRMREDSSRWISSLTRPMRLLGISSSGISRENYPQG